MKVNTIPYVDMEKIKPFHINTWNGFNPSGDRPRNYPSATVLRWNAPKLTEFYVQYIFIINGIFSEISVRNSREAFMADWELSANLQSSFPAMAQMPIEHQ